MRCASCLLLPLLVACSGSPTPHETAPDDAARVEALVGHPLRIDVESGSLRSEQVAEIVARVYRELRHMRDSIIFAHAAADIDRVVILERKRDGGGRFDHANRTLIVWPGPSGQLAPETVRRCLTDEYEDHLRRWFDHRWPAEVSPERHADYFYYLDGVRRSPTVGATDAEAALGHAEEHETIRRMCQLADVAAGNPALGQPIRRWLVAAARYVAVVYRYAPTEAARMAEGSSFAQAETALAGWLGRELGGLDDELQLEALEHLFVARDPRAFRGLDRFAAGASVVRRWLRAGAPPTETQSAQGRLFDYVVCQPRYAEGSTDVVGQGGGHCRTDTFFDFAFGSADGLERMVDLVAAVDDERFTEVVATHAPESLWSALEPHVAHWRVFAMHYARRAIPPSSIDEVWERFIPGRGLMLYVLATRHGRPGQGYWRTWGQRHAAPIAAAELASMLDAVPPSVAHVPWMRAAFGAWSLVDVLVPRLPVLADVPETPAALLHVAQELCRDGERADVLRLQQSVAATLRPKAAAESARFRPLLAYDCRSKPVVPFAHR